MFYEDQHKLAAYLERHNDNFEYTNAKDGKPDPDCAWVDPTYKASYYTSQNGVHLIRPVLRYGLPSHLQSEIHNPDNLTEEQICEGGKYRAVLKSESAYQPHEFWTAREWRNATQAPSIFSEHKFTYRLPATVPWPDWEAGPTDPKDARIAELEAYIHTIRPKADCYDRVCQTLGIEKDITGHVKHLKAQLAASPWRRMSEVPTEEDGDSQGYVIVRDYSGAIFYWKTNPWPNPEHNRNIVAWMPVPKFPGWPDPLADLLKAHGVAVTPELTAALNAWKGVEK